MADCLAGTPPTIIKSNVKRDRPQLVCDPDEALAPSKPPPPAIRYVRVAPESPSDLTGYGAHRVSVVAEIDRLKHSLFKRTGRSDGPERRLDGMEHVTSRSDLVAHLAAPRACSDGFDRWRHRDSRVAAASSARAPQPAIPAVRIRASASAASRHSAVACVTRDWLRARDAAEVGSPFAARTTGARRMTPPLPAERGSSLPTGRPVSGKPARALRVALPISKQAPVTLFSPPFHQRTNRCARSFEPNASHFLAFERVG